MKYSKRRVHIAPVGYEVDRVVIPILNERADRVYLITEKDESIDKGKSFLSKIVDEITDKGSNVEIFVCGTDVKNRDLYDVLKVYRLIIEKEKGNHIFVNVSTGTKIHAIAGMMTSMIFKSSETTVKPYYVTPDDYSQEPERKVQLSVGCKEIKILPSYQITRASDEQIDVLQIIDQHLSENKKTGMSKSELIDILEKKGYKLILSATTNEGSAKHMAIKRKYLDPLCNTWNYITIEGERKKARISITEDGKNALKFLKEESDFPCQKENKKI